MKSKIAPLALFPESKSVWMDRALTLASNAATLGEVPVGCVVVNAEGLVSEAHNEKESQNNPVAHAEMLALQRAAQKLGRWRLSDCTVFVSLEPCYMCAGAMIHSRVGQLIFGATDPKTGAVQSLDSLLSDSRLNHQCPVHGGFKAEQSSAILKQFFRSRRSLS